MSAWLTEMQSRLPDDRFSTGHAARDTASRDQSTLSGALPDAVAWPLSTVEVADLVAIAFRHGVPVTARGAGSSLEGNPIPLRGGVVLDLSRMDQLIALHADDLIVEVQPGAIYERVNQQLRPHGLFFPPHPGGSAEIATIGGMVANNASGIYSVRYGGTRDYVRAATVVTGTGEVVRLGTRCRKTSSGYHLIGLLVGSEGTLAIATEITLALAPLPVARRRGACLFDGEHAAAAAIAEMMRFGIALAAVEFLDRRCVRAVNRLLGSDVAEQPLILLELHGADDALQEQWNATTELCTEHGGTMLDASSGVDPWSLRHDVSRAIQALQPDAQVVRTDLAVPVSQLPEAVGRSYALAAARSAELFIFGHAGLGILHALILAARADAAVWANATALKDDIVEAVLRLGGSVSGEHGLGIGNRKYAAQEHGNALNLMRGIKQVFDPKGILNPGKIWED